MSREERKAMIAPDRPDLSLSRQCRLLSISRSSFYYAPRGESPENLALMRRIDKLFLRYPFYGGRQMARQLRREGHRRPPPGSPPDAADGPGGDLSGAKTSTPHPGTGFILICSGAWRWTAPIRSGAPTSPTFRCGAAFST